MMVFLLALIVLVLMAYVGYLHARLNTIERKNRQLVKELHRQLDGLAFLRKVDQDRLYNLERMWEQLQLFLQGLASYSRS